MDDEIKSQIVVLDKHIKQEESKLKQLRQQRDLLIKKGNFCVNCIRFKSYTKVYGTMNCDSCREDMREPFY